RVSCMLIWLVCAVSGSAVFHARGADAVTVASDDNTFILANGIVTARVAKRSGDIVSLKYEGIETLAGGSGHPFGYWSHAPGRGARVTNSITIDPSNNGGKRGEVSVKGFYQ